jgi:hypothetical protein
MASIQLLAWLFDDADHAALGAARDLAELGAGDVLRPELLEPLVALGPAVEVLRCAAELEREALAALGPPLVMLDEVAAALTVAERAAPGLATSTILPLRSLRLRGRVRGAEIWIGAPSPDLALEPEHVAWQAAHEATVREVSSAGGLAERRVEAVALVLLAERAARAKLASAHRRWLQHLAGPPAVSRASLRPEEQWLLDGAT